MVTAPLRSKSASDKTTVVNECFDRCNDSIWINGAEAGNHTVRLDFLSTVPGAPVGQGLAGTAITAAAPSGRRARIRRHVHVVRTAA